MIKGIQRKTQCGNINQVQMIFKGDSEAGAKNSLNSLFPLNSLRVLIWKGVGEELQLK
jgi:hypothetical protein